MATPKTKKAGSKNTGKEFPLPVDYRDEVTDEQLERIQEAAKIEKLSEKDVVSGPGW